MIRLKSISKKRLISGQKLATETERHHATKTLLLCFIRSSNITMLKSISKKRLSSELRLATEKEKELITET